MTWVVDTCVVLDVLEGDPEFGLASARLIDKLAGEGLSLCPVSYIELAPAFAFAFEPLNVREEFFVGDRCHTLNHGEGGVGLQTKIRAVCQQLEKPKRLLESDANLLHRDRLASELEGGEVGLQAEVVVLPVRKHECC